MKSIENINIDSISKITSPKEVKGLYPVNENVLSHICESRSVIENIISGKDNRLFVIVGPCSIHDPIAAIEYAKKLKDISNKINDKIFVIMRVYFEKPRTTIGWKGLINDPYLDDSFMIEEGLKIARELMIKINELGLPIATEALDPISPQYLSDLVSWAAIGARTTESQTHREMASGLSFPIGFKNATNGSVGVSINAILSASKPHAFLGVDENGLTSVVKTKGNQYTHIILRGGSEKPNYDKESVENVKTQLITNDLLTSIVIDCSHANSEKNYKNQSLVLANVVQQIVNGETSIKGVMIESNLKEGNQNLSIVGKDNLEYGLSITDGCLNIEETEEILTKMYKELP